MMNIVKRLSKMKLFKDRVLKMFGRYEKPITVGEGGCRFVEDEWDEAGYHLEIDSTSKLLSNNGIVRVDANYVPWKPGGKRILVTFYRQENGNAPTNS